MCMEIKTCSKCKLKLNLNNFYRKRNGHESFCKNCKKLMRGKIARIFIDYCGFTRTCSKCNLEKLHLDFNKGRRKCKNCSKRASPNQ